MFGFFKLILLAIVGIVIAGIVFFSSIFNGETVSKDGIINTYDSFLQNTSINGLTKDNKLEGKREYGIDEYVGIYKANYNNKSKEETIFGGTTLNRKNGNTNFYIRTNCRHCQWDFRSSTKWQSRNS